MSAASRVAARDRLPLVADVDQTFWNRDFDTKVISLARFGRIGEVAAKCCTWPRLRP
jgi:hypothetical protein